MNTYSKISNILFLAVAFLICMSCTVEKPIETDPVFPEMVTVNNIAPGTELTLEIQPNMDWTVSIPVESYKWFKIIDGRFEVQSLSGKASASPVTITIKATDKESFSLRTCEVVMTMGGRTEPIASYSLVAGERMLEVYRVTVNDAGKFSYVDGKYVYEETPMIPTDTINLVWEENEARFYYPIKVEANYEWTLEHPEWLRADIVGDSRVGDTAFEVYGVSSMLPLDGRWGELKFKSGDETKFTCNVWVPGCRDMFAYNFGGHASLTFDHAAYFHSATGASTQEPVRGTIFGPADSRVLLLELTDNGYAVADTPWLDVEVSRWDGLEGADVLQSRTISVSAPKYFDHVDRQAILLCLPATAPKNVSEILSGDKMQVKEEYASYAISVVQTGRPEDYFVFEAEDSELETFGITFGKSAQPLLPEKNFTFAEGSSGWQYDLSYTKDMASSKSALYLTEEYESYSIYDAEGNEIISDLSKHWLSFNLLGDGLYGQFVMEGSKVDAAVSPVKIDGYVVFKDEEGKVLSIVHCFYEEEQKTEQDVLEDAGAEMFNDPSKAAAAGASIHKVVSGPTYEQWKELSMNIYKLTYTESGTTLDIKTSEDVFLYLCAGKMNGPEMVRIDNDVYDESQGHLLTWSESKGDYVGTYDGVTSISMNYTESYAETIQFFDRDNAVIYIFVCELNIK